MRRNTFNNPKDLQHEIHLVTMNGYGSTNTVILRWTTILTNTGFPYMTLLQSAANGDSITINIPGLYYVGILSLIHI
jgi:hypothetical protein